MKSERKNIRFRDYDYSQSGYYFVTICTYNRKHLFGEIKEGIMVLNDAGEVAEKCIYEMPEHFSFSDVDYYCIMPNHIHAIIVINNIPVENRHAYSLHACSLQQPNSQLLPVIVGSLKPAISKFIHHMEGNDAFKWQKSYYEHIIRNYNDLYRTRNFITNNPINWEYNKENNIKI